MTYPQRIRLSRAKGWRLPEGTINCARPGPWGNPFRVGQDGDAEACVRYHHFLLAGYRLVVTKATTAELDRCAAHARAHLAELCGHDLACWCRLDRWCHCDTLLVLANGTPPLDAEAREELEHFRRRGDAGHVIRGWRTVPNWVRLVRFLLIAPIRQPNGDEALTITPRGLRALGVAA